MREREKKKHGQLKLCTLDCSLHNSYKLQISRSLARSLISTDMHRNTRTHSIPFKLPPNVCLLWLLCCRVQGMVTLISHTGLDVHSHHVCFYICPVFQSQSWMVFLRTQVSVDQDCSHFISNKQQTLHLTGRYTLVAFLQEEIKGIVHL